MFCPNCRKELPEGTKFCGGCGTPIAVSQAPAAPAQPVPTSDFAEPVSPMSYEAPVAAPVKPAEKGADVKAILNNIKNTVVDTVKKIPSKYLKIGAAAVAVVLLIVLVSSLFGGEKAPNFALYMKDEEVYFTNLNGKAGKLVTDEEMENYRITMDGKKLFYIDGEGDLYYSKTSNFKKPVELDSKVSQFWVSENGKTVVYKTSSGALYTHNLKKEEKIAKYAGDVAVSPDGKIIYFMNDDGDYVCWKNGKEEEIDDRIDIEYISEDFKTIIYSDGKDIFLKKIGKEAKEIASDIAGTTGITADGTFYFWTYPEGDAGDYFDDKDLDGEMNFLCTLYYFNGSKAKKIANNVYVDTDLSTSNMNGEKVAIFYYQFGKVAEGDLDYEDLKDLWEDMDYEEAMIELLTDVSGKCTRYIGINGKAGKVKLEEEFSRLYLSSNGKTMYALVDVEDGEGTLMKASVSGNKVKTFKEVDSDVSAYDIEGFACAYASYGLNEIPDANFSDLFVYFKDVENDKGELFVNGESVADDVSVDGMLYNPGKKAIMFFTDAEEGEGTLNMYNGKKLTEVAQDVGRYTVHGDGDVIFTTDYDNGEYTLNLYTGKVKEIAKDVSDYVFTADGDILYRSDVKDGEGDLYLYTGKSKLIDDDVTNYTSGYYCNSAAAGW